jgi:hypothetical protein
MATEADEFSFLDEPTDDELEAIDAEAETDEASEEEEGAEENADAVAFAEETAKEETVAEKQKAADERKNDLVEKSERLKWLQDRGIALTPDEFTERQKLEGKVTLLKTQVAEDQAAEPFLRFNDDELAEHLKAADEAYLEAMEAYRSAKEINPGALLGSEARVAERRQKETAEQHFEAYLVARTIVEEQERRRRNAALAKAREKVSEAQEREAEQLAEKKKNGTRPIRRVSE